MKSVCRLGAVEFGFKVFSFQFHPGKFMSPPMIIVALFIALALVTDVSKFLILVYTEFDLRPVKLQQQPRTIPLYNKANWYGMKIDLQNIKHTLSNMFKDNDCQVTNMWNVFKESAVKHIPQKRTKVKDSRPWINTEIRKKSEKATKTLQAEK
jgi:hypothetical protein